MTVQRNQASADEATLAQRKQAMREMAQAARDALAPGYREAAGKRLRDAFMGAIELDGGGIVSAFAPAKGEIDVMPLFVSLIGAGHEGALPVVAGRGMPLLFRAWAPGHRLVRGNFGIEVPEPAAPEVEPDLLLVPLLAFDRRGQRLGWGAGFYDRTLAALRDRKTVIAVGIAFAAQEVDNVPHGPHDQRLDWVVTESEAIRTGT